MGILERFRQKREQKAGEKIARGIYEREKLRKGILKKKGYVSERIVQQTYNVQQQKGVGIVRGIARGLSRIAPRERVKPTARITQARAQGIARALGGRIPGARQGTGTHSGRGRPRGTYKYIIPGKGAVSVFEFRKWLSRERTMAKMQQQQALSQGYAQQMPTNAPQSQIMPQGVQYARPVRQPIQPPNQMPLLGENTFNALKVPNPFKQGAPPVQQPVNPFNVDKPVTNPNGDWYTEPDFITGKQVLKRRVREGAVW